MKRKKLEILSKLVLNLDKTLEKVLVEHSVRSGCYHQEIPGYDGVAQQICMAIIEVSTLISKLEEDTKEEKIAELQEEISKLTEQE